MSTQFVSVFVVKPAEATAGGRTLLIGRLKTMSFIDSADAWCDRQLGQVNTPCRGMVMGRISNQATVLADLRYSASLYDFSTGGKTYGK
ncbi:hypothetical protein [Azorhizobium oxalatiphilum]|uniref:hypothetical protein n=1 Tax=Azorhizobium oxalatiphilum TaxID=980631 RepID=UPI001FCEACCB|nr:hypothetical protein [Azorhizobium oxalatiphilum]